MSESQPILDDPHLLLREAAWLQQLARSLCSDRFLAEDLSQDVLLTAWQSRGKLSGPLRPWLAGVLRRLAANRRRAQARRLRREAEAARAGGQHGATAPATDEVVARASLHESVVRASSVPRASTRFLQPAELSSAPDPLDLRPRRP